MVLLTLDTTRADYVGWNDPPTNPDLAAIVAQGVRFGQAVTVAPETRPAHATMFTGVGPLAHGVVSNRATLDRPLPTVAEDLRDLGYRTAAFVSSSILTRESGLARGFDTFDDEMGGAYAPLHYERRGSETTDRALGWLQANDAHPFFLWVHYFDPHAPYDPPSDLRPVASPGVPDDPRRETAIERLEAYRVGRIELSPQEVARYRRLYAAEVAGMEREIVRLVSFLLSRSYGQDLVLAIAADHGESLAERSRFFEHNRSVFDEVMRIPLALRYPGAPALRVDSQVSLVGLAATLLELAGGVPRAEQEPGWLPFDTLEDRPALYLAALHPSVGPWKAVWREPPWKYGYAQGGRELLVNLVSDPEELVNRVEEHPEVVARLGRRLAREIAPMASALEQEEPIDEAAREMLRSLGYLQ